MMTTAADPSNPLAGKNVVLGVTGGIAAYKAVDIVSRLRKRGAEVYVIMTREATEFVTELTFREMSGHQVAVDMWSRVPDFHVEHIALANLADIMLIAPATANVIAKAAHGIADDMLTTTLLATTAPLYFVPAMNVNMYQNAITQQNIAALQARGARFIGPASGMLACGTTGPGRLVEPAELIEQLAIMMAADERHDLAGRHILVTAGGTREPLDPVRYLGNRSTGKMGFAIAEAAQARGARVTLVAGPSSLAVPAGVECIPVETALEMREAVLAAFDEADAVIKAAAVADYRPKERVAQKIKKQDGSLLLELVRNPDILKELGEKKTHQLLVGFAAETEHVLEYARGKLAKKNLDFIVANDVSRQDAGFSADTNRVAIIARDGSCTEHPLMSKRQLADIILDHVAAALPGRG